MKAAIFLDRDGVIISNKNYYYIWKQEQMQLVDGIAENLKKLLHNGFRLFIISNQGGISRGLYSKNDILNLHQELSQIFRKKEIEITDIAFCPHHPEIEKCLCRKPEALMIDKLIAKHHISREFSYFIGDSESDMAAAKNAGIEGIRIVPNQNMYSHISFLIK